jgi:hypothetical protein
MYEIKKNSGIKYLHVYLSFIFNKKIIFCFNIQVALVIFLFINSYIFLIYFIMYKLTSFCFSIKKFIIS